MFKYHIYNPYNTLFSNPISITEKVCHSKPYLKSSGQWACAIKVSGYMTFKSAFVQCKKRQGKLPMIKSIQEQSILNQIRQTVSNTSKIPLKWKLNCLRISVQNADHMARRHGFQTWGETCMAWQARQQSRGWLYQLEFRTGRQHSFWDWPFGQGNEPRNLISFSSLIIGKVKKIAWKCYPMGNGMTKNVIYL